MKISSLALAMCLGLGGSHALALSLGRLTVQSALGEPLRAVVEIPDINAEEFESLKPQVASAEAFRTAGLEYSPVLQGLHMALQKTPDGRVLLRLTSERSVLEPFMDLILVANWNTGRIVRDYTLLFDPPSLRAAPASQSATAVLPRTAPPASAREPLLPRPAATRLVPEAAPVRGAAAPESKPGNRITVQPGDTASSIAATNKPAQVSLDQMLVAMLQANPHAFIQGNVNFIKAGAVIDLPSDAQLSALSPQQASQTIVAQSRDFNDFRQKLALNAPAMPLAPADRQISGTVQAKVDERTPQAALPDKLTLSKAALPGQSDQAQATAGRAADGASKPQTAGLPAAQASGVASTASAAGLVVDAGLPPAAVQPAASAASAAVAAPASAVVKPAPAKPVPASAATPEAGMFDDLLDNPLLPGLAAALVALLAGWGYYRFRQRQALAQVETEAEAEAQPELDAALPSEPAPVVTPPARAESAPSPESRPTMVFSPSQFDQTDEVDPVAEAEVYLAYGRDIQAEEILKEALRTQPSQLSIHHKLLEIYAKRNDAQAFEAIASSVFALTQGKGADWAQVCDLGKALDPDNPLYHPAGPQMVAKAAAVPAALATAGSASPAPEPSKPIAAPQAPAQAEPQDLDFDLDLDLDFSMTEPAPLASASAESSQTTPVESLPSLDFSFDEPVASPDKPQASKPVAAAAPSAPAPVAEAGSGMMEFDLGSLSLDLGDDKKPAEDVASQPEPDPLEIKLALAEELRNLGDEEGARALIEEVIAQSGGVTKAKAQQALRQT